jgi:ABC-type Fe3+-hydroxamate transport system substrate-binding protein
MRKTLLITALILVIIVLVTLFPLFSLFKPHTGEISQLTSISPANGSFDIPVVTKIKVAFSEEITLDKERIEESFSIKPYVKGSFYWDGNTLTFLPKENLAYNTTYTMSISSCEIQFKTAKEGFPLTIADDLGRSTTIKSKPERIISLAPSNTEILFALGLGDKVIGVTEYCNYPEEAKEKKKIGGYVTPNIEKIVALQPDLVLAAHGLPIEVIDALERYNLTVVGLHPKNLDDILYDIRLVGEITGQSDNASVLVANMAQKIEATEEGMKELNYEEKPTVLHIIWHDPIWVAGRGTIEDELIRKSGGINVAPVEGYRTISLEEVIKIDPEIIITPSGTGMGFAKTNFTYEYIIGEPRLSGVDAVTNNRVYVIDADIISRAGPRIVDALEEIKSIVRKKSEKPLW